MRSRVMLCLCLCVWAWAPKLFAQRVIYCEPYSDRFTVRTELAGRVGEYYWLQNVRRKRVSGRYAEAPDNEEASFDIYDMRMKLASSIPVMPVTPATEKQYFIPGDNYFDHLQLLGNKRKTGLFLQRYEAGGNPIDNGHFVGVLPFDESGNSFILVRSQDRSRILLLGFQTISVYPARMHVLLFDRDWQLLSQRVYVHPFITQPMIQDDFNNYPLEDFNGAPVKLANDGEWLMAAPSRTSSNFLLFHFNAIDTGYSFREIQLPAGSGLEDVNLSVDNEKGEAFAAVLSTFRYDVLKNVEVVHYSMSRKKFDFDSSYRFSTQSGAKTKDENLVRESFIAVPGSGFMLLKEYGRPFTEWYQDGTGDGSYDMQWDPALLLMDTTASGKPQRLPRLHDGYARYSALGGRGEDHVRGDLSLFYLPGSRADSGWSAMLSREQVTELNGPNISYFVMPVRNRLFLMYNNFYHGEIPSGATTVLDRQGDVMVDEGVMFWKFKSSLRFQQARQISENEVVIPYDNLGRTGYAVVRF